MRSTFLYGGDSNCTKFNLNIASMTDFTNVNINELKKALNEKNQTKILQILANNLTP